MDEKEFYQLQKQWAYLHPVPRVLSWVDYKLQQLMRWFKKRHYLVFYKNEGI